MQYDPNDNHVNYNRENNVKMTQHRAGILFDSAELNKSLTSKQMSNNQLKEIPKTTTQPILPVSTGETSINKGKEIKIVQTDQEIPQQDLTTSPPQEQPKPTVPPTTPPKKQSRYRSRNQKRAKPEDNPNYPIAMSRRRNYTDHLPYGSKEFKQASIKNLDPSSHGICEQDRCLKYVSGKEVPFDYSTECTLFASI